MDTNELSRNPCYLYKHFDSDGNLLYVGISFSVAERISQHKKGSNWFADSGYVTILKFPSRSLAEQAERIAIRTENPLHNVIHKVTQRSRRKKWKWTGLGDGSKYEPFYKALAELDEKLARLQATRQ